MDKQSGVYMLSNLETGKVYIGSSVELDTRIGRHFSNLKTNKHENEYLQRSYNKHGKDAFVIEVLVDGIPHKDLKHTEQYFMDWHRAYEREHGYNICRFAAGSPMLGRHHSDNTKKLLSEMFRGEKGPNYGKKASKELRKKLSENHVDVAGEKGPRATLTNKNVVEIKNLIAQKVKTRIIAETFGVSFGIISKIKSGQTWKCVIGPQDNQGR